jgi:hypothetical protein
VDIRQRAAEIKLCCHLRERARHLSKSFSKESSQIPLDEPPTDGLSSPRWRDSGKRLRFLFGEPMP